MGSIIINGRRMNYSGNSVSGQDIIDASGPAPGRRPVIRSHGMEFQQVQPGKLYGAGELTDKRGNPVKVTTIPDRTKGREVESMGIPNASQYQRSQGTRFAGQTHHDNRQGRDGSQSTSARTNSEEKGYAAIGMGFIGVLLGWVLFGFIGGVILGAIGYVFGWTIK